MRPGQQNKRGRGRGSNNNGGGGSNNNNNFAFSNGIIGVSNTGAPIRSNTFFGGNNNNDNEFFVARVGVNWKFGS